MGQIPLSCLGSCLVEENILLIAMSKTCSTPVVLSATVTADGPYDHFYTCEHFNTECSRVS